MTIKESEARERTAAVEKAQAQVVGRRAELMAELLLQDLQAVFVAKPASDLGYDFLVGFPNSSGGINSCAVEVKATEKPVPSRFPLSTEKYKCLARSNIPALLLVVDVKRNRVYYAWLTAEDSKGHREGPNISVPVTEVTDEVKAKLRRQLSGKMQTSKAH